MENSKEDGYEIYLTLIEQVKRESKKEVKRLETLRDSNVVGRFFKTDDFLIKTLRRDDLGDIELAMFSTDIKKGDKIELFSIVTDYIISIEDLKKKANEISVNEFNKGVLSAIKKLLEN